MADSNEEMLFNNEYCARVRAARERKGWTAEQMATALGIPADRYRKYEVRSPMPLYLVERLCIIADEDIFYMVTGKRRPPGVKYPAAEQKKAS